MNESTIGLIDATIGQLLSSLLNMADTFVGTGYVFLSLAFTLAAISGIYQWWTSGSIQDLVANGVRTLIVIAPLLILFNGWGGYMNTFGDFFYKELPSKMGVTGGTAAQVAGDAMKQISGAVKFDAGNDSKASSGTSAGNQSAEKQSLWSKFVSAISMAGLYSLLIQFLVFILNMLLMFGILFALFMPIASLYIGMIFGPLLLAWLIWRPLADMGARWFSFMISNGINFVVAIVILKAMSGTISAMTTQLNGMAADGFATGLAGLTVTLIALLAIYIFALNLMLAANNIAQGMTGGAAMGEGLFGKISSGMSAAAMMAGGRMMGKGTVKGGAGATSAVLGGGGKALTAAGNTMGTKGASMLSRGGTVGNKLAGSALSAGAMASYASGKLASGANSIGKMDAKAVAQTAGSTIKNVVTAAGSRSATATGAAAGKTANVIAVAAQKGIDGATRKK